MRKNIITVVGVGGTLNLADGSDFIRAYTHIIVGGTANDAVKFTLNGTQMVLPGGSSISIGIESLSVQAIIKGSTAADADIHLVCFGYEQKNTLFGN